MDILFSHERLSDFLLVEELLIKNRLLIDAADIDSTYPCHLVNYSLYPTEEFFCLLDRNIVSYLIEMVKGRKLHEDFDKSKCFRLAAGLQAFLNAAGITSEPGLSYNEYMEHVGVEVADRELAVFRSADNLDANIYLDIALSKRNYVPANIVKYFPAGEIGSLVIPDRIKHFEFNIVVVKKALILKAEKISDYQVMHKLLDWLFEEYVFTSPAFHFLSIYFSSKRVSGMLKSDSYASVRNASWDLCLLQHWASLAAKEDGRRWLLATMDDAIKKTASLMLLKSDESQADYFQRIEGEYSKMWGRKDGHGKSLLKKYIWFLDNAASSKRKINNKENQTASYMLDLRKRIDEEFREKILSQQSA